MRTARPSFVRWQSAALILGILALLHLCSASSLRSQTRAVLTSRQAAGNARPFYIGERLSYGVRVSRFGAGGKAVMWIEGPVNVRGTATELLRFDFEAKVGPMKAIDRTSSWLDPDRMASYRFSKRERHPLSNHDENVELFPAERRWRSTDAAGESLSDAPLDELSFMYFIRTLRLVADTLYTFDRHFDAARNPTTVRVVRRESVTTKAGEFRTVLVEMRVRDPRRYHGEGVIRINLSDDPLRLPVRIESTMPMIGTAVMSLETYTMRPAAVVVRAGR